MRAGKLTSKLIDAIERQYGGYAVDTMVCSKAGVPDIIACIHGQFIGLEVKVGKDKLTPLQREHLGQIAAAGGYAYAVGSLEELHEILKNIGICT